jgi:hypothetical protein
MSSGFNKRILWINLVVSILGFIYLAGTVSYLGSVEAFIFSTVHVGINLLLAIIISILCYIKKTSNKLSKSFLLSAGLILLVSFPACYVIHDIGNKRFNEEYKPTV